MRTAAATRGTATAGQLRAGDRVMWLTPYSTGQTARILAVRNCTELPGCVVIIEAPDEQNHWWPGAQRTRRFPRTRLVACVIARAGQQAG
jgi:hypothetical protein